MQRFRDIAPQSSNIFLANLGGPWPTLWRLEAVPLKGFGVLDARLTHDYCCCACVPEIRSIVQAIWP